MLRVQCFSYLAAVVLAVHVLTLPRVSSTRNFDRSFLRKIFKCPTCQLDACPLPEGFPACEVVLEPGVCACCPVCAQQLGDSCGLTTGRCGKGLTCRPMPDDPDPIGAILSGNAICM